ncbi:sigma-54 dependent transcriptional regulator [Pirellulales bacterium]|nr:sigma-54 dependent transcriptional regulator [Pirellulales bacterium]
MIVAETTAADHDTNVCDAAEYMTYPLPEFVAGEDPAMKRIAQHAERAAQVECTVLVTGDTGTGKEVWARRMHELGPRRNAPFIPVNCAALTPTLAESQLFGHEKGAFTGADGASLGVFRAAHTGVILLDEVGDMPMELQPKLLRVLQESEVTPVGSARPMRIDVQVIAATNLRLEEEVAAGRFREDLFYRLNMVELRLPSLRERRSDIPELAAHFSQKFAARYNQPERVFKPEELARFCEYDWPGNVRQLAFLIEQAYVLDCAPQLPNQPIEKRAESDLPFVNLARLRAKAVSQAMRTTGGRKGDAAKLLGVHPNTMTRLLSQSSQGESHDAPLAVMSG